MFEESNEVYGGEGKLSSIVEVILSKCPFRRNLLAGGDGPPPICLLLEAFLEVTWYLNLLAFTPNLAAGQTVRSSVSVPPTALE